MAASKKQIADYFFKSIGEDRFKCVCGTTRKKPKSAVYENLMSHIREKHPNYAIGNFINGKQLSDEEKKVLEIFEESEPVGPQSDIGFAEAVLA